MSKKLLFLFIISALLAGYRSVQAVIRVPHFNINVIEQSVGGDANFSFHYDASVNMIVYESKDFQIQTASGSGSYTVNTTAGQGTIFSLTESDLPGWQNTGVSCVSDDPSVTTSPYPDGISIHAVPYSSITCTFTNTKQSEKPNPVIIIPGILGSAQKDGVWVMDPIFHTYDDLIATLAANGYEEGKTLFTFPYDWRNSNVLTAVALRDKINEVKNICQCDKVDLVAHSMGGLVARQYIESDYYGGDVDQLIFLGTPHLGAPKAYLPWEGATLTSDRVDQGTKYLLTWDAYKLGLSLFDYIRQDVVSLQQLLPTYDYLVLKNSGVTEKYPNGYPVNLFLENLNDDTSKLLNSGVIISNIIGDTGASTITSITIASSTTSGLWEYGHPDILNYGVGDETVPVESASYIEQNLTTLNSSHVNLPGEAESIIYNKLTGKTAQNPVHNGLIPDVIFIIKILSPADIQVVAPDGSIVGKDFATGEEINQIPGAFYSGFQTDDEYVTIPNPLPGDYVVKTVGTGSGSYTVATGLISDTGSSEKEVIGTTKPDFAANVEVGVSDDGTLDVLPPDVQAITPDSVIADIELAFSNGWLKNKQTKNTLIKEVKAMIKVEKKIEKLKTRVKGKNIEKKVARLETRVDKVLAQALKTELKLYNKGKILSDEGFNLIKNDIELLILVY